MPSAMRSRLTTTRVHLPRNPAAGAAVSLSCCCRWSGQPAAWHVRALRAASSLANMVTGAAHSSPKPSPLSRMAQRRGAPPVARCRRSAQRLGAFSHSAPLHLSLIVQRRGALLPLCCWPGWRSSVAQCSFPCRRRHWLELRNRAARSPFVPLSLVRMAQRAAPCAPLFPVAFVGQDGAAARLASPPLGNVAQ